jgi:predicted SAM-dependent methyltransferase
MTMPSTMKRYLNLGCGTRFHPDWINMDVAPSDPRVIRYDLTCGIPLADAECTVVYHSAVLEHFRPADALAFLRDCHRVLEPGGTIRVGVPDLEQLCRLYLDRLEAAQAGDSQAAHDYDWIMLEIFDQMVRERSGGAMLDWLRQDPLPNPEFVDARIGEEGRELLRMLRGHDAVAVPTQSQRVAFQTWLAHLPQWRRLGARIKHGLLALVLGKEAFRALEIGRFRLSGEVHQWMYDRYSLSRLLLKAGFKNPTLRDAATSQIPDWDCFGLDRLPDGTALKPDLLFLEATK